MSDADDQFELDCGPTKQCRNMAGVTFEGFGPEGMDLRTAWRTRLAAEGKLHAGNGTVRDLVLGEDVSLEATGPIGSAVPRHGRD